MSDLNPNFEGFLAFEQPELVDVIPGVRPAQVCKMPEREDPKMAAIYRSMREAIVRMHCSDKRPAHRCAGAITIDRTSITLNCPRCGDHRSIIEAADAKR